MDTVDRIVVEGAKEYRRIEGEPYTNYELAQLWKKQQLGSFSFRLLARFALWSAEQIEANRSEPLFFQAVRTKAYIDETLQGIKAENDKVDLYANIGMSFLLTDSHVSTNYGAWMVNAPTVLLPYILPKIYDEIDSRKLIRDLKLNILKAGFDGYMSVMREVEPNDFPIFIRPIIQDSIGGVVQIQIRDILTQILESGIHTRSWWFDDISPKINDIHKGMCRVAEKRADHYHEIDRHEAERFFRIYSKDDTAEIRGMVSSNAGEHWGYDAMLDSGIMKSYCILNSPMFGREDTAVTELLFVLDDAIELLKKDR